MVADRRSRPAGAAYWDSSFLGIEGSGKEEKSSLVPCANIRKIHVAIYRALAERKREREGGLEGVRKPYSVPRQNRSLERPTLGTKLGRSLGISSSNAVLLLRLFLKNRPSYPCASPTPDTFPLHPNIILALRPSLWFLQRRMKIALPTGKQIQTWRLGLGRTQMKLAECLDVSPKALRLWEYGSRDPRGPARLLQSQIISHPSPVADTEPRSKAGRIPLDTSLLVRHGKPSLR